jgi:Concanavalin A-like lectin/glucanases superfamily
MRRLLALFLPLFIAGFVLVSVVFQLQRAHADHDVNSHLNPVLSLDQRLVSGFITDVCAEKAYDESAELAAQRWHALSPLHSNIFRFTVPCSDVTELKVTDDLYAKNCGDPLGDQFHACFDAGNNYLGDPEYSILSPFFVRMNPKATPTAKNKTWKDGDEHMTRDIAHELGHALGHRDYNFPDCPSGPALMYGELGCGGAFGNSPTAIDIAHFVAAYRPNPPYPVEPAQKHPTSEGVILNWSVGQIHNEKGFIVERWAYPFRGPPTLVGTTGPNVNTATFFSQPPGCYRYTIRTASFTYDPSNPYSVAASAGEVGFGGTTCPTSSPPGCITPTAGIVSWWPGDVDGSDIVSSNHGSVIGTVNFSPGYVGNAFTATGAGFVVVPDHPSLDLTGEVTLEFWLSHNGSGGWRGAMAKRVNPSGQVGGPTDFGVNFNMAPEWGLGIYYNDPGVTGGDDFNVNGAVFEVSRVPVPSSGVFHHVAGAYRQISSLQVEVKTYVDGVLLKTLLLPGNLSNAVNDAAVTIASSLYDGTGFVHEGLVGSIDEVSIYSRALTQQEIAQIHTAGSAGKCKP